MSGQGPYDPCCCALNDTRRGINIRELQSNTSPEMGQNGLATLEINGSSGGHSVLQSRDGKSRNSAPWLSRGTLSN